MPSDYTISVKDFGPIEEATVDLRPLTIFIGPSNTGKSYLAGLFYALHRSPGPPPAPWRDPFDVSRQLEFPRTQKLSEELDKHVQRWISTFSHLNQDDDAPALPEPVVTEIKRILRDFGWLSQPTASGFSSRLAI